MVKTFTFLILPPGWGFFSLPSTRVRFIRLEGCLTSWTSVIRSPVVCLHSRAPPWLHQLLNGLVLSLCHRIFSSCCLILSSRLLLSYRLLLCNCSLILDLLGLRPGTPPSDSSSSEAFLHIRGVDEPPPLNLSLPLQFDLVHQLALRPWDGLVKHPEKTGSFGATCLASVLSTGAATYGAAIFGALFSLVPMALLSRSSSGLSSFFPGSSTWAIRPN